MIHIDRKGVSSIEAIFRSGCRLDEFKRSILMLLQMHMARTMLLQRINGKMYTNLLQSCIH